MATPTLTPLPTNGGKPPVVTSGAGMVADDPVGIRGIAATPRKAGASVVETGVGII